MESTQEAIVACTDRTMNAHKDLDTGWVGTKHHLKQLIMGKKLAEMTEEEKEQVKKALEDCMKENTLLKDFLASQNDTFQTFLLKMAADNGVQRRSDPGRKNTGNTASADSGCITSTNSSIIAQPEDSVLDEDEKEKESHA